MVPKYDILDYHNSDNKEDSLHYHHNNRIKASDITKDGYVYFTQSYLVEVPSSILGWETNGDSSRDGNISDDTECPRPLRIMS